MLFSILIPVYNVEKWMRKCIESVLSQNMKDFEIVLVDDGSTDSSGEICDEYASRHDSIRVIHKKNEGLLLTRRRAIKEAKGKWFIHLDSDDYMMPGFLSSLQNVILETDPTLVIYSFIRGTQDTHDLSNIVNIPFMNGEVFEAEGRHKLLMQFLYGGSITAIWQKAARRDIVDIDTDYHQWPNVNMMEDHLQSLYLLDHSLKTVYMDFPAVYYRYNAASITKQIGYRAHQAAFQSMHTTFVEEERYYDRWRLNDEDKSKIMAKHLHSLCIRLGMMTLSADISDNQKEFKDFMLMLSEDRLFLGDYVLADKKLLGRKSQMCYLTVRLHIPCLVRFVYQNSTRNI